MNEWIFWWCKRHVIDYWAETVHVCAHICNNFSFVVSFFFCCCHFISFLSLEFNSSMINRFTRKKKRDKRKRKKKLFSSLWVCCLPIVCHLFSLTLLSISFIFFLYFRYTQYNVVDFSDETRYSFFFSYDYITHTQIVMCM